MMHIVDDTGFSSFCVVHGVEIDKLLKPFLGGSYNHFTMHIMLTSNSK